MKVGFIGLGNVGGKLAGNLLANGVDLVVRDLEAEAEAKLTSRGAAAGQSPAQLARDCDILITCLPSPAACAATLEGAEGVLEGITAGTLWMEMSTTDAGEVQRLAALVEAKGAMALDCPVSGGCHRAATGNISIFAGGSRAAFEAALPVLRILDRDLLHTGPLGSASTLKVATNYLATANLVTLCEALVTMKAAGLDLATTYEAFRISSGNSFVHETESQVILNGSRDISFTMDLVNKDIGLFQEIAEAHGVPLEVSPLLCDIFRDGEQRFGARELSPNIIKRLESATGLDIRAPGFPAEMEDNQPPAQGKEVKAKR